MEVPEQPPSNEALRAFVFNASVFAPVILFYFMDYIKLQEDVNKGLIGTNQLLSGTKLITSSSRESPEYSDNKNFPFWYHLGKQMSETKTVVQAGSKLGLPATCFLQSCHSVIEWDIIQSMNQEVYEGNIIRSNINLYSPETEVKHHFRRFTMQGFMCKNYDLAILTEKVGDSRYSSTDFLNVLWDSLKPEGLLVCDYIDLDAQGEAFQDFCRVKNREPHTINTRYGVGIIER